MWAPENKIDTYDMLIVNILTGYVQYIKELNRLVNKQIQQMQTKDY